jgi:hydroxypyruvate reductase
MSPRFENYRQHIDSLITAALKAADPAAAVNRSLKRQGSKLIAGQHTFDLRSGKVYLVGVGKAATAMSEAAANILGPYLFQGIIISKRESAERTESDAKWSVPNSRPGQLRHFLAGHPVSDKDGLYATAAVIEMLQQTGADDLLLSLISGGTSALLTHPRIKLNEWQQLVRALLESGCTIRELNAVRKQLDPVKGGGLAQIAAPAACLSLILSDVVGNPLDVIGSGPTVPIYSDPLTARAILSRYDIHHRLPHQVWQLVDQQLQTGELDSPEESVEVTNLIIGDVRQAAEGAVNAAERADFEAQLLTAHLEGEARQVGLVAAALAKDMPPGSCRVLGGETTVTVRGDGLGSRNLELALSAAISLTGWDNIAIATLATDGDDGPAKVAGARITGETVNRARDLGLDPLDFLNRNDSYHFFEATGGLIDTGPTGTNVNDLLFLLRYGH